MLRARDGGFVKTLGSTLVFVTLAMALLVQLANAAQKPNVVMIFIDDMGYADIGAFGMTAVPTPNMDRLAKEGIKFTNFYVNSPICSASRVALNTGIYPQRERIHSFLNSRKNNRSRKMPDFLNPDRFTYAKMLKNDGYATAHFGKWHIGGGRDVDDAPLPQAYGYDESLVSFEGLGDRILWSKTGNQKLSWEHGQGEILDLPKHKTTETYVDRAIDFIDRNKKGPFLVNVFPNDVHDYHDPSEAQLAKWKGKGRSEFDDKFFAILDELDRQIGRLLNSIDNYGLAENTIVILTSDNGPTDWKRYYNANVEPPGYTGEFFGRKWSLYEGGIRMPFMIRWPAKIRAGQVDDSTVVAAIDMLPSLGSLTGSKIPEGTELDGIDMSEALLGSPMKREKSLFWEYGTYGSIKPGKPEHVSPLIAMRDGDWKMLMNPDGSDLKLFNLKNDPSESTNLAKKNSGKVQAMKPALASWWSEMDQYYRGH